MEIFVGAIILVIGLVFGYILGTSIGHTHCDMMHPHDYSIALSRKIYLDGGAKKGIEEIWVCKRCGKCKRVIKE